MRFEEEASVTTKVITKIGVKLEEMLENVEKEQQKAVGARSALLKQVDNLVALSKAADEELEKTIPTTETLELVKSWLFKAVQSTKNFADHYINVELACVGEAAGYKATHDLLQKMSKQLTTKLDAIKEGISSGDLKIDDDGDLVAITKRPSGVRPGPTIKQQRKAEDGGNGVDVKNLDSMSPEELEAYLLGEI